MNYYRWQNNNISQFEADGMQCDQVAQHLAAPGLQHPSRTINAQTQQFAAFSSPQLPPAQLQHQINFLTPEMGTTHQIPVRQNDRANIMHSYQNNQQARLRWESINSNGNILGLHQSNFSNNNNNNNNNNRNKNFSQNQGERRSTKVLLACIFNKNATLITHDILYRLFNEYGEVQKILIFEKSKMWKAFVEMKTQQSAEQARIKLDNYAIFNDGSNMNVYPSNMQVLNFQNGNSGGVDYTQLQKQVAVASRKQYVSQTSDTSPPAGQQPQCVSNSNNSQNSTPINVGKTISASLSQSSTATVLPEAHIFDSCTEQNEFLPPFVLPQKNSNKSQYHLVLNKYLQNTMVPQLAQKTELPTAVGSQLDSPQQQANKKVTAVHKNWPLEDPKNQNCADQLQQVVQREKPTTEGEVEGQVKDEQKITDKDNTMLCNPVLQEKEGSQKSYYENAEESKEQIRKQVLEHIENSFSQDFQQKMETSLQQIDQYIDQQRTGVLHQHQQQQIKDSPPLPYNQSLVRSPPAPAQSTQKQVLTESFLNCSDLKSAQQQDGTSTNNSTTPIDPANYVNLLFVLENRKSKVVYVRGLESEYISVQHMHNLFSNFGNIHKMIFLRAKRSCLIEYESVEHATNAKDLMNSKILMGNAIRIFYSNYEEINLEQIEYISEDVFIGGEETFRFKKNKHLSVNPPSQTLHVSNLKQESCNERIIRAFFSTHGVIEGVKFISQAKKNMCLVKFATVEQAVDALMLRHGIEVLGRKVQISFTHSKIN